jgi:uncharacterized protein (DUF1499 family)
MKLVLVAAGAVLLFLLAGFGLALWSRRPVPVGLVDGRLRPCPPRPNCVCSEDADAEHATAPLAFTGDPDAAFASLVALIEAEPRARLVAREGDWAHATWRSPFFGFVDDVELALDREARTIAVRSAARAGQSDLGKNRERVELLRARFGPGR